MWCPRPMHGRYRRRRTRNVTSLGGRRAVSFGWPPDCSMTTKNIKRPSVANDAYFTPDWVVQLALREIVPLVCPRPTTILEPGAGHGAFVKALRNCYPSSLITAVDIEPYEWSEASYSLHGDFLTEQLGSFDLAIGNPPFSLAMPFITRCLSVSRTTVLLLRQGFLSSAKRNTFFRMHVPSDVFILPNRPSFDGQNSDSSDYCFVCWGRSGQGTRLHWLSTVPIAQRR